MERGFVDKAHLTDKLQFSVAAFAGLKQDGAAAHDASDRLIYNTSTGALYYDADGQGGAAAVQVALIGTGKTHPVVDWTDIQLLA
ncbi:MAG: hypothetical protein RJA36_995 [Pseudomonadota bacterium]